MSTTEQPHPLRSRLRAGEVGCFRSHKLAWEKMRARGGFVIEDDARLNADCFERFARAIAATPSTPRVIFGRFSYPKGLPEPLPPNRAHAAGVDELSSPCYNANMYWLDAAAAEALLAASSQPHLAMPSDDFLAMAAGVHPSSRATLLRAFAVVPAVLTVDMASASDTNDAMRPSITASTRDTGAASTSGAALTAFSQPLPSRTSLVEIDMEIEPEPTASLSHGQALPLLLLPALATNAEACSLRTQALRAAAHRPFDEYGRLRMPIASVLGSDGVALCDALLLRAVRRVQAERPVLIARLFGRRLDGAVSLLSLPNLEISRIEPAINVYRAGGRFMPHEDKMSITVLVALSDEAASFEGGGTGFWAPRDVLGKQAGQWTRVTDEPTVLQRPPAGSALVFGGTLTHAAQPVTSGMRCVLVASFSLSAPRPSSAGRERPRAASSAGNAPPRGLVERDNVQRQCTPGITEALRAPGWQAAALGMLTRLPVSEMPARPASR